MTKPHPALIEIAAGRPAGSVPDDEAFVDSALLHRMAGLAYEATEEGRLDVGPAARRELAAAKLVAAAHNVEVERAAVAVVAQLRDNGWETAIFKGVATARRWYPVPGTRATGDVDLLLSPTASSAIEQVLALVAPGHSLAGKAQKLFDAGRIQSIDFVRGQIWIDLHTDPIKVGIDLPNLAQLWERTTTIDLAGVPVLTLDAEASLLQGLIHLIKDRFSRLHGFVDIARIARDGLDWRWVQSFARDAGLYVHVNQALRVVSDVLQIDLPYDREARSLVWRAIWPERIRLRGQAGMTRKVRSHYWIPLTMPGRRLDGLRWLSRIVVPPADLVEYMHPDTSGPYPLRVMQYRSRLARERHQRNKAQRRQGTI